MIFKIMIITLAFFVGGCEAQPAYETKTPASVKQDADNQTIDKMYSDYEACSKKIASSYLKAEMLKCENSDKDKENKCLMSHLNNFETYTHKMCGHLKPTFSEILQELETK